MKKIAFFVQHMLCGGVENALIALTDKLKKQGHDVTIYVIAENGDFISHIPKGVNLKKIPLPKKIKEVLPIGGTKITIRKNIKERQYLKVIINLKNHLWGKTEFAELNINFNKIPNLKVNYDIAVNFHMHSPFLVRYVSEKVTAKKKLSWIHNDFTTTNYNIKALKPYLECCDSFFGVSQKLVNEFISIFPEFKENTKVAINLVPIDKIQKRADKKAADEFIIVPKGYLKLLSVGRLEHQKGYDLTIEVCKKLLDAGFKFKWFILGDGSERLMLESKIKKEGLGNTLYLLGIKMNPYPYFKDCDIYVQTSRHEGWGLTVTEAKAFYKPIVVTNFAGASEQLRDGIDGDIAEINVNSIYDKLVRLFNEPHRRKKYTTSLSEQTYLDNIEYMSIFEE